MYVFCPVVAYNLERKTKQHITIPENAHVVSKVISIPATSPSQAQCGQSNT